MTTTQHAHMAKIPHRSLILLVALSIATLCYVQAGAAEDPFPVYPCIRPNVSFWKKVFSQYSSNQGIIHDSDNLNIIYEVVELKDRRQPNARKINRKRVKRLKKRYKKILGHLAAGKAPSSPEERRVLSLFGPSPKKDDLREAAKNIRFQLGQKDRFRAGIIRSGAYLEEIKGIFRKHGLPVDLVYLPHVESSFNINAYSKFGAAGIWQFTRSTGKRFLNVNYEVDERRDPIRSSEAAARLLKENYEKLGSWPLSITAYNHGVNGMLRAKERQGGYELIFQEYEGRLFKFASRNFYSEWLAARDLAKNYQTYFGALPLQLPQKSREVVLPGFASLSRLADYFHVDIATIRTLNPAIRTPVYNNQKYLPKGYHLRLPAQTGINIAGLITDLPADLFLPNQKRSRFYRVRSGDTAGQIAERHGIKLADLILANRLDRRATIYAGQNLRLPVPGETAPLLNGSKKRQGPGNKPMAARPEEASKTTEAKPPGKEKPVKHRPAEETAAVKSARLETVVNPAVVSGNFAVQRVVHKRGKAYGIIKVEAGETLGHYADWLEIPTKNLREVNGLRFGSVIRMNQTLKVPLAKINRETFEERRYLYHKELEEDFFATYRVEDVKTYRIKKGDNIWSLCQEKFALPLWLIKKYNASLDLNGLRPSQKVIVPMVEKGG